MIVVLIHNLALLAALVVGVQLLARRLAARPALYGVTTGILFGVVGVIGMMTPLKFAPGVIYDGRSIVLSLAGLFGGPLAAAMAAVPCGVYRIYLGGPGAPAGVAVILESAVLGSLLHYLRRRDEAWVGSLRLWAFGVVVHAIMMALQLMIPGRGWDVLVHIGPSVLAFYPLCFLLITHVFLEAERRQKAEEALRQAKEDWERTFDATPDMVCLLDKDTYTVRRLNRTMCDQLGVTPEDAIGRPCFEIVHGASAPPEFCPRACADRDRAERGGEFFEPRLGRWLSVHVLPLRDAGGNLLSMLHVARDITERKQAEETLHRSEQRNRAIVSALPDMLFRIDAAMRLVDAQLGDAEPVVIPRDFLGRRLAEILPANVAERAECHVRATLAGDSMQTHDYELPMGGSVQSYEARMIRCGDDEVLAVVRNVTEHKELEAQLRQARKMEAVGQLAGGIAHDFNNLLQVINGYCEMALIDLPGESPAHNALTEVANAGERAATLVGQLLAFSRRRVMRLQVLDLNAVAADLIKILRRLIGEHVRLEFAPAPALAPVEADRGMMEQILMNLCVNGRDAMPDGGALVVETKNVTMDEEFCRTHVWAKPGAYVLLVVTDTGCGMAPETLERIFEPFFTTKQPGSGTGLGLATVYGIARQHGGMIAVSSEIGKGSTFRVYLPAATGDVRATAAEPQSAAAGGHETILLAEDDSAVRALAQQLLESAGYTVLVAEDGDRAVALLEQHANEVALALLDVVMPGSGGRRTYDRMRYIRRDLPVLFASGYSEAGVHTNFVLDEGLRLIQKPYSRDTLLRAVRAALDSQAH